MSLFGPARTQGKFGESRQAFLALAAQDGDTVLALKCKVRAAQCLLELGDFGAVKQECTDILNHHSSCPDKTVLQQTKHLLAAVPYRQKHWTEAVESLGQYIRQNPDDPQLAYSVANRTDVLEALGRPDPDAGRTQLPPQRPLAANGKNPVASPPRASYKLSQGLGCHIKI